MYLIIYYLILKNIVFKFNSNSGTKKEEDKAFICITNKTDHLEAQELSKMFEKFYRVDKSRSSQIHGSGIGLAIVKRTIELHEGKVWAESHGNSLTIHVELQLLKNV